MLVGELIEMMLQDLGGDLHLRRPAAVLDLKQETFLKVACAYTGRFKLLNDFEHGKNLLLGSLDICPERKVIHHTVNASSQIAVIVKAANDERSHSILMLGEIAITQLLLEALSEALLYRKGTVLRSLFL